MAATGNEIIYVNGESTTLNDFVTMVYDILNQRSTDVSQFPVANSLTGINSLPALRMAGTTAEVVTVSISLLKGADGKEVEMRFIEGEDAAIQWKYTTGDTWQDLLSLQTIQAPAKDAATEVLQTMADITGQWDTLSQQIDAAILNANDTANHPTDIGEDYYVYKWDKATGTYNKTDIFLKGPAFTIRETYTSIAAMNADVNNPDIKEGDFVLINTNDVENPDNAQIYVKVKNPDNSFAYQFLVDMSGAIGFTGKTPQYSIGLVSKTQPGGDPHVAISPDGTDDNGNPKFQFNFVFPTGDTGPVPLIEIGTITTGQPGTNAQAELVENGFTPEGVRKYLLNLTLPEGMPGDGSGNVYIATSGLLADKLYLFKPNQNDTAVGTMVEYTIPVSFSGDYNDLTNKPYVIPLTLDHVPGANDISYNDNGMQKPYPAGAEVRYFDTTNSKYVFYKLHAITETAADWRLSGRVYGAAEDGGLELNNKDEFSIEAELLKRLSLPDTNEVTITPDQWTQPTEGSLWKYTLTDPKLVDGVSLEYWPDRTSQYFYIEANVMTDPDTGLDPETGDGYVILYAENQPKDNIVLKYLIKYTGKI